MRNLLWAMTTTQYNALKTHSIETGFAKFNFLSEIIIVRRRSQYTIFVCTGNRKTTLFLDTISL